MGGQLSFEAAGPLERRRVPSNAGARRTELCPPLLASPHGRKRPLLDARRSARRACRPASPRARFAAAHPRVQRVRPLGFGPVCEGGGVGLSTQRLLQLPLGLGHHPLPVPALRRDALAPRGRFASPPAPGQRGRRDGRGRRGQRARGLAGRQWSRVRPWSRTHACPGGGCSSRGVGPRRLTRRVRGAAEAAWGVGDPHPAPQGGEVAGEQSLALWRQRRGWGGVGARGDVSRRRLPAHANGASRWRGNAAAPSLGRNHGLCDGPRLGNRGVGAQCRAVSTGGVVWHWRGPCPPLRARSAGLCPLPTPRGRGFPASVRWPRVARRDRATAPCASASVATAELVQLGLEHNTAAVFAQGLGRKRPELGWQFGRRRRVACGRAVRDRCIRRARLRGVLHGGSARAARPPRPRAWAGERGGVRRRI